MKWITENVRFAFTGNTEGAQTLVFERDGIRLKGRDALDLYETQLAENKEKEMKALQKRWQGDDSPDFTKAAQALRQRYEAQLTQLRQQFA